MHSCMDVYASYSLPTSYSTRSRAGGTAWGGPSLSKTPSFPSRHFDESRPNVFHQWPWRTLAFASDLGIIAQILKKPKFAGLGWLVALPYYGASIASRPSTAQRQEEGIYQLTANGLFPILEAHLGIKLGALLRGKLATKIPGRITQFPQPVCKGLSALLGLMTLTPLLGDRISDKIIEFFRSKKRVVEC